MSGTGPVRVAVILLAAALMVTDCTGARHHRGSATQSDRPSSSSPSTAGRALPNSAATMTSCAVSSTKRSALAAVTLKNTTASTATFTVQVRFTADSHAIGSATGTFANLPKDASRSVPIISVASKRTVRAVTCTVAEVRQVS